MRFLISIVAALTVTRRKNFCDHKPKLGLSICQHPVMGRARE